MKRWMKGPLAGVTALGLVASPVALAEGSKKQQQSSSQQGTGGAGQQGQQAQGGQQAQQQGKELSGKVSKVQGNELYLESKDGAIIPLRISSSTRFEGQLQNGQQLRSARELNEGDEVSASFTPQANENRAHSLKLDKQAMQEVSGKVARTGKNELWLESSDGAYIPVSVSGQTQFKGQTAQGKQIASAREIRPGDEVRASFTVQNDTRNVAQSVEVTKSGREEGTGGAGMQQGGKEQKQQKGSSQQQGSAQQQQQQGY